MKKILLYGLLLVSACVQAQELLPYPTDTIDGKVYYRYTVEKSIGLYRISKNFGVSQEDILRVNPDLRERGLRFEEQILIPTNLPAVKSEEANAASVASAQQGDTITDEPKGKSLSRAERIERPTRTKPEERRVKPLPFVGAVLAAKRDTNVVDEPAVSTDTTEVALSTTSSDEADGHDTIQEVHYTDTVRLAYLLPLHADLSQRSPVIDRFYDFYAGSLLALKHHDGTYVDSLGEQHTTYYDVHTYDIGKGGQVLCALIDSGALAHTDAFVGPTYYKQVEALAGYAQRNEIPVMVPFLPSVPDITTNPSLLKFNAYEEIQIATLMNFLDTLRNDINIVLVDAYASSKDYADGIRKLRDSIAARRLPTTRTTIRQILADSVHAALKDSVENILLFHSERYSNVQLLMPYLQSGKHGKRLTILSQYAWQTERILLPQLFTSVFSLPQGEAYERYEQDFAQYFGHKLSSVHPRYDLLGYDLTRFMLQALQGGAFSVPDKLYEGLQSSILLTRIGEGGYENTYITVERR